MIKFFAKIIPSKLSSSATGRSINALKQIVKKSVGANYSSGSRPNQTAKSWGSARLTRSITGGKASAYENSRKKKDNCTCSSGVYWSPCPSRSACKSWW